VAIWRADADRPGRDWEVLGLPKGTQAALFDLDGVLTQTAKVHAKAWKEMFDDFLRARAQETGEPFVPFDAHADYDEHVDGLPRADGVRGFLASRHIELPEGDDDDPPAAQTVHGLGNRKNELVLGIMARDGVQPYAGSVKYVDAAKDAGLKVAVVSSSANARDALRAAGILDRFEHVVDGHTAQEQHLKGKPAPDMFLAGARAVGVDPAHAAVFEDALAGVQAGHAGHFGRVVGVDRVGQADALREHGADVVVKDLSELLDDHDRTAA
jgi:beta-phosphoglucomutase family hydrolase